VTTLTLNPTSTNEYGGITTRIPVTITGVLVSETGLDIPEAGGTDTYTVVLNTRPRADVTIALDVTGTVATVSPTPLTFTRDNWDTAQTVTVEVAGVDDAIDNDPDRTAIVSHRVTSTDQDYDGMELADVTVTATDGEIAGVRVTPLRLTFDETGSGTYQIVLDSQPLNDVTITPSSSDGGVATVPSTPLTFTPANWNVAQEVTVTGVGDGIFTVTPRQAAITNRVVSDDPAYDGRQVAAVAIVGNSDVAEPERVAVIVSKTELIVPENGSETYTVRLGSRPPRDVGILWDSGRSNYPQPFWVHLLSVSPPGLRFTPNNWNVEQTVTLSSKVDDTVSRPDRITTFFQEAFGPGDYNGILTAISVRIRDDETPAVNLSREQLSFDEGGAGTYQVVLNTRPSGDVTVTPESSDGTVATVSGPLTFTPSNWNRPQIVTVTGVDDAIGNNPNRTATVTHTVAGADYASVTAASVTVTAIDNEGTGVTVVPTGLRILEEEGGTQAYQVRLNSQPTANVTVTPVSGDRTIATVSEALTFTPSNWDQLQTVMVTAVDDTIDNNPDRMVTVTHTVAGGNYAGVTVADVTVTVIDNEGVGVTVVPLGLRTLEGQTQTYQVRLNSQPTANVTVTPVSGDGTIATVSGPLTFTPRNWDQPQTVTVTAVDDSLDNNPNRTVTVTHAVAGGDYDGIAIASVTVTAIDNEGAGVTVAPIGLRILEGGTQPYTVRLNSQPTADVTVGLG